MGLEWRSRPFLGDWVRLLLLACWGAARAAGQVATAPSSGLVAPTRTLPLTSIAGCAGLSPGSDEILGGLDAACRLQGVIGREET
jgi:hypothetical protein